MRRGQECTRQPGRRKFRRRAPPELRLLGAVLVAAGLTLLFLCIPGWAWAALIGAGLVIAGWWLIAR
ncbi:MAG: hypothetical protein E7327_01555 [Clostridiales bacterium]|nr:hypothetical protein [Clostridiales bacterium]